MEEYDIVGAFDTIEKELITSMIVNLDNHKAEETDMGIEWSQWQVEQLKCLEKYKSDNQKKYRKKFKSINRQIEIMIRTARENGGMEQEIEMLEAMKKGFVKFRKSSDAMTAQFFRTNDRKLDALIKATIDDMKKAETAILRMTNDKYRQIIFNAQVYANTGAGTYEKAVDMATKDMLSSGLSCVEYANGSRHTLKDYADMAIRTASKRAYLTGEGEKRKEWGISTVIINKRGNPCPKCLPWVGKILIDDVWSGGKKSDGPYPLMSTAVAAGLYHPRCKDSHTTYFEGISTPPDDTFTGKEISQIEELNRKEAKQQYAERQTEKYERLANNSLDPENQKNYTQKEKVWESIAKSADSDIIKPTDTKEVVDVHVVGKIDKEIYKCIADDIVTDEVIITDNQIRHIKDRHPNDYERFSTYFGEIVGNPDYIIESLKPNTALILKEISKENEVFKTVLRLVTSNDTPEYKNSIITFMKIDEKEWGRLLRNKKILYKKE